jgi:hypothetical protein
MNRSRPRFDSRWSLLSLRALVLENRRLCVVILPELGGRIWSIVYKPHDRELLWHNPRIAPRKIPFGAAYDDVWCGGWEEIFPNDAPAILNREPYPDHGETWAIEWEWSGMASADEASVTLFCQTPISGMRLEKRIRLSAEQAGLTIDYHVQNPTGDEVSFLFKLHAAMAVEPGYRIDFPAGTNVEREPAFPGTLALAPPVFPWPEAHLDGKIIDLSQVPADSDRLLHFFYGTGYRDGWCSVSDPQEELSCGLVFDPRVFGSCWLFGSFGGWRNYRVAVLEPSTSYPFQVERAAKQGKLYKLAAGAALQTQVTLDIQEAPRWQPGSSIRY